MPFDTGTTTWWRASDGRWYPPSAHPGPGGGAPPRWHPGHAPVQPLQRGHPLGIGTAVLASVGFVVCLLVAFTAAVAGSGGTALTALFLAAVLGALAVLSVLSALGRGLAASVRISQQVWEDAARYADERLAEQLRLIDQERLRAQPRSGASQRPPSGAGAGSRPSGSATRTAPRESVAWARDVLHVGPDASVAEVRAAYRRQSKKWHPDLFMQAGPAAQAEADHHMQDINAAHVILEGHRP